MTLFGHMIVLDWSCAIERARKAQEHAAEVVHRARNLRVASQLTRRRAQALRRLIAETVKDPEVVPGSG